MKRTLVKDGEDSYADLVCLEGATAIDRVIKAERKSDICAAFFAIMHGEEALASTRH